MSIQKVENGSVTTPAGFLACGITVGFKRTGAPDMALLFSEKPCTLAGTFTSNRFPAAPVILDRERVLSGKSVRAVVINSGIANACAGNGGYEDALRTCDLAADALRITPEEVLVASTGRIGTRLPMDLIEKGVKEGTAKLTPDGGTEASRAIMTTDTRPKSLAYSFTVNGKKVSVGGMCKGAGMIAPMMTVPHATMLCFITTDAAVPAKLLQKMLGEIVPESFNRVSVDGDMSTNDTVLVMANGVSGVEIAEGSAAAEDFRAALKAAAVDLAKQIAMDGEGATKFVTVNVKNAASVQDAENCARTIATSMLCKTAWFGCDPNWGRVLAAAGRSGAVFTPEKVNLFYNEMPVVRGGVDAGTPEKDLADLMAKGAFEVNLDLGAGTACFTVWTCDISYEYVKINADYHT